MNDSPVAADDATATPEDTAVTLDVRVNDTPDPANEGGQTLTVTPGLSAPASGTAVVDVAGTVTYTPAPNFTGVDSFSYQVCDSGAPSACDTAVVTVTVTPANDPPDAVDDSRTTAEDTPVSLDPRTNDSTGPPDEAGQTLTVTPGSLTRRPAARPCSWATQSPTRRPPTSTARTRSRTRSATGAPPLCDTATVSVTVTPINDPPVAVDDAPTTNEDTPVTLDVRTNDEPRSRERIRTGPRCHAGLAHLPRQRHRRPQRQRHRHLHPRVRLLRHGLLRLRGLRQWRAAALRDGHGERHRHAGQRRPRRTGRRLDDAGRHPAHRRRPHERQPRTGERGKPVADCRARLPRRPRAAPPSSTGTARSRTRRLRTSSGPSSSRTSSATATSRPCAIPRR